MNVPKSVGVIIPTFKRNFDILSKAITSVYDQDYPINEVIVVSDNFDKKLNLDIKNKIKKQFPMVKLIIHKKNKGACAARNTGIKNSNSEYIAFLDDDDLWKNDKISKQIKLFNSDTVLVYSGIKEINYEVNTEKCFKAKIKNNVIKNLLISNYIGTTSSAIVKKDALIKAGMFDINLPSGQDLDLYIRLKLIGNFKSVENCLTIYNLKYTNTITTNLNNRLLSNLYLKKKYAHLIKEDKMLTSIYTSKIFKAFLINKKIFKGFKYLIKSILKKEFFLSKIILYIIKNGEVYE